MKRVLLALILALVSAAPAQGAEYQVYGCDAPDGRARGMQPFGSFEVPLDSMNHDDYCQAAAGLGYFEWAPGMVLSAGRRGGWRLDSPLGTTFTRFGWLGSAMGLTGTGARVEIAAADDGATLWAFAGDIPTDQRRYLLPDGMRTIVLRQACRAVVCSTGVLPARTTTNAIAATLEDHFPPTASGFSGTLIAAGPRQGTAGLTFTAQDIGAGVQRATLDVDGSARWVTIDGSAACTPLPGDARGYDSTTPCAPSAPVELTWATTGVRDGPHTVRADVADAAGNVRTVFGPVIVTTDNTPPIAGTLDVTRAGQALTATPSGFDGQQVDYAYRWQRCDPTCEDIAAATHPRYLLTAADAGRAVRVVVTASDLGGATTVRAAALAIDPAPVPAAAATATATAAARPAATATPAALVAAPAPVTLPDAPTPGPPRVTLAWREVRADYGQRVEIDGRARDADGAPLAGATFDVRARLRVPGARERREGGVGSARDGRFTYVAPAGASRDLTIGGGTVKLLVRAAGTLTATRQGRVVTLRGRVRGGHIPRGGVLIELSANGRTVRLTRTDATGAFSARVTTTRAATRPTFRAVARKDSSWPFVAAPVGSPASA